MRKKVKEMGDIDYTNERWTISPTGIDGWLLLYTIGLFLSALLLLFNFLMFGLVIFFTEESGTYDLPLFLAFALLAFLTIYSLVLEFKKKREFPNWAIATLWANVVVTIVFSTPLSINSSNIFIVIILAIIWTWYFKVSERVQKTFVK